MDTCVNLQVPVFISMYLCLFICTQVYFVIIQFFWFEEYEHYLRVIIQLRMLYFPAVLFR